MLRDVFGRNLFDDWFDFPFYYDDSDFDRAQKKLYGHRAKNIMKTDITEKDGKYLLEMDLPGFSKDDVKVSLKDGYLTVSANKNYDSDQKNEKSGKYIRRERYSGSCERSFYVGDDVSDKDISGKFEHGILSLSIPKTDDNKLPDDDTKYIDLE